MVSSSSDATALGDTLQGSTDRPLRVVALGDYATVEMAACAETVGRTYGLSPRERDVLLAIMRGDSNEEIAEHLGIALRTVKTHVESTLRRTGAPSRHALMGLAAFGITRTRPRQRARKRSPKR